MSSLTDKLRQYTSLDPQPDESLVDTGVQMAAGFVPIVGQGMALRDFERARRDSDPIGMGLSALSLVPGGHLVKALRGAKNELIAGRRALKAPNKALDAAQEMAEKGADRQSQWDKTRAYMGHDKQMKWEINDDKSRLMFDPQIGPVYGNRLVTILDHPEAYENYPFLKDVWIRNKDPKVGQNSAYFSKNGGVGRGLIAMGAHDTPEQWHSSLLHEIQHAIQSREPGFSTGANSERHIGDAVINMEQDLKRPLTAAEQKTAETAGTKIYLANMGETESRSVEKRWADALRNKDPYRPWNAPVPTRSNTYQVPTEELWHESWPRSF